MYTHTCTHIHVHTYMYTHTCTHIHVHTYMYTKAMFACLSRQPPTNNTLNPCTMMLNPLQQNHRHVARHRQHMYTHIHEHMYMCTHTCTHMYMYTHTFSHMYMYTHTCTQIHVHTHAHTYTCTHVRTYMYTHILRHVTPAQDAGVVLTGQMPLHPPLPPPQQ